MDSPPPGHRTHFAAFVRGPSEYYREWYELGYLPVESKPVGYIDCIKVGICLFKPARNARECRRSQIHVS